MFKKPLIDPNSSVAKNSHDNGSDSEKMGRYCRISDLLNNDVIIGLGVF